MPTCLLLLCLFRLDATTAVDARQLAQIGHIQAQERDDRMLLYPADSVVLLNLVTHLIFKSPHLFAWHNNRRCYQDDHCYSVKVTLFLPSFDDCLTFCPRANVTIDRDAVAIQVEGAKVISTDDKKVIKLCDEDFSALVRYLQKDSDSLSEDEENDWDNFESEGCQDNFSVLVDSRVMLTKSGRSIGRPVRLDS